MPNPNRFSSIFGAILITAGIIVLFFLSPACGNGKKEVVELPTSQTLSWAPIGTEGFIDYDDIVRDEEGNLFVLSDAWIYSKQNPAVNDPYISRLPCQLGIGEVLTRRRDVQASLRDFRVVQRGYIDAVNTPQSSSLEQLRANADYHPSPTYLRIREVL